MGALHFLFLNNDWNSRQGDPATGCSSMSRLIQVLTVCSYPYVQIFRIFTVYVIISVHNLWIKYGMSRIMRISVFRISHQSWHKSRCKITKDRQRLKVSDFECRGPSLTMWRKQKSASQLRGYFIADLCPYFYMYKRQAFSWCGLYLYLIVTTYYITL